MVARKILKVSSIVAIILLVFAIIVWGLRITEAVGNLHVKVQVHEQRLNILSSNTKDRNKDGTIQDESP